MCCPFAHKCPSLEVYARTPESRHLVWVFCLGEHRDCDCYKERIAEGEEIRGQDGSGVQSGRDAILSKLRLNLERGSTEDR